MMRNRLAALVAALSMVVMLTASAFALTVRTHEYTAGKANSDSLGTAADTLSAVQIPENKLVGMFVGVRADTAAVLYTGQVSLDGGTTWATIFADTAAAGTYDEHELGEPTSGTTVRGPYYGFLPGKHFRVIADNLGATIQAAEIFIRYETD